MQTHIYSTFHLIATQRLRVYVCFLFRNGTATFLSSDGAAAGGPTKDSVRWLLLSHAHTSLVTVSKLWHGYHQSGSKPLISNNSRKIQTTMHHMWQYHIFLLPDIGTRCLRVYVCFLFSDGTATSKPTKDSDRWPRLSHAHSPLVTVSEVVTWVPSKWI